jgi:FdhD protein
VEGVPTAITMRTPGHDLDLVAGFLFTEGVVDGIDDVRAMAEVGENTVDVRLAEGVPAARARSADRALYATSSCGICGKASIERLRRDLPSVSPWSPSEEILHSLPSRLRAAQATFGATGGLHGAALFDATGELFDVREDVGRHNAVDKVIGARVRSPILRPDPLDLRGFGLVSSSRAGFEIVAKALVAGIPVIATIGAPSSLAVETARAARMTLIGWLREDRYTVYA